MGLIALLAIQELSWVLFAPWAVDWLPGLKLPGAYAGQLEAEQGARYGLLLHLEPKHQRTGPGNPRSTNLRGRAQICTPTGTQFFYTVSAFANRSADDLTIWMEYPDPTLSQLNLRLEGVWHGDSLLLRPHRHNPFAPDGSFVPNRPSSSADPSDYFAPTELRKGMVAELLGGCSTGDRPAVGR